VSFLEIVIGKNHVLGDKALGMKGRYERISTLLKSFVGAALNQSNLAKHFDQDTVQQVEKAIKAIKKRQDLSKEQMQKEIENELSKLIKLENKPVEQGQSTNK
jgi:hypothetical protein